MRNKNAQMLIQNTQQQIENKNNTNISLRDYVHHKYTSTSIFYDRHIETKFNVYGHKNFVKFSDDLSRLC